MKSSYLSIVACVALACGCSSPHPDADSSGDHSVIVKQMHDTWDRPGVVLDAGPVVIDGDYAVADWTQGDQGGRALLKRTGGTWETVLCSGDGLRHAEGLVEFGLSSEQAKSVASRLADAEKSVSPERLARMASFKGVVRMAQMNGHDGKHH